METKGVGEFAATMESLQNRVKVLERLATTAPLSKRQVNAVSVAIIVIALVISALAVFLPLSIISLLREVESIYSLLESV